MSLEENTAINPKHYQHLPNGIQAIQVCEHFNFNKGNAIKYIFRAGFKNPSTEIEDLTKAKWYLEREIERLKKT